MDTNKKISLTLGVEKVFPMKPLRLRGLQETFYIEEFAPRLFSQVRRRMVSIKSGGVEDFV